MRTLSVRYLPKRNISKWPKIEVPFLQRILSFLVRDLVPSFIILIVISFFALLVGGKIDRAKQSHTVKMANTVGMADSVSPQ